MAVDEHSSGVASFVDEFVASLEVTKHVLLHVVHRLQDEVMEVLIIIIIITFIKMKEHEGDEKKQSTVGKKALEVIMEALRTCVILSLRSNTLFRAASIPPT